MTDDDVAGDPGEETWMVLMDPAWRQENENDPPPLHAVVGLWPVAPDGAVGKFRSNPDYEPSDEQSPTDPLDAVFRLVLRGPGKIGQIQVVLHDVLLDVALNGDGRPLIVRAPDGLPCVVATSSVRHQTSTSAFDWQRLDLDAILGLLPDDVDVLFNPGASASIRLTGDFLRNTAAMGDEELVALRATSYDTDDILLSRWHAAAPERPAPAT
ncbi:type VII secretion system-associated protein [Actinophytocola oryzae]|uniref:Uncharacterized protein n=1 Tax=Actinophytocola oryzae TaxID=502181 RepID=A0A4R7UTW6_9PSEU|nr:type VII secretion system-associated protein [Actinophytocola oryzae]TDV38592.1 hypothetical protein CLV71_12735 [Actinophytocola oryzae]